MDKMAAYRKDVGSKKEGGDGKILSLMVWKF
jgi:hypothetical protein